MSNKNEIVAGIDVGSNAIRMKIAVIKPDGKVEELEDVRKTTTLGKDTFSYGRVHVETIYNVCETLKGFMKVMKEYHINDYRAVSTSGIREAANRDYILEQIKQKTGMGVKVINNAEERFLTYKAIRDKLPDYHEIRNKGTVVVDIGSGGVELSLYDQGSLQFTEYIKVGSLRLREVLADLERRTLNFPEIMEQFIVSKIYLLGDVIKSYQVGNFIGLGGELKSISFLCNGPSKYQKTGMIRKEDLEDLLHQLRSMTVENIIHEFGISRERAEVLLPSTIIFLTFLAMTKAQMILTPMVSLRDGLIAEMVDERFKSARNQNFMNDIVSSARYLGRKYHYDQAHAEHVEKMALSIFDQTKRIHGLGERQRFYLQMAAILHDIGKFINLNRHDQNSFDIIEGSDIMGLSNKELQLLANVVRYHSEETPSISHYNYKELMEEERVLVSKLSSILQIADSFDITHMQKVENIKISGTGELVTFHIDVIGDALLEEWTFETRSLFFEEVFGAKPILKYKGRME